MIAIVMKDLDVVFSGGSVFCIVVVVLLKIFL